MNAPSFIPVAKWGIPASSGDVLFRFSHASAASSSSLLLLLLADPFDGRFISVVRPSVPLLFLFSALSAVAPRRISCAIAFCGRPAAYPKQTIIRPPSLSGIAKFCFQITVASARLWMQATSRFEYSKCVNGSENCLGKERSTGISNC